MQRKTSTRTAAVDVNPLCAHCVASDQILAQQLGVTPSTLHELRQLQFRDIVPEDYDALSQLPSKSFKADVSLRETLAQKRFEKGADTAAQWASEAEEELERCLICLEEMKPKAVLCSLTCEHTFHADCLDGWLQRSSQCPTCRVQLCVLDGELAHEIELA